MCPRNSASLSAPLKILLQIPRFACTQTHVHSVTSVRFSHPSHMENFREGDQIEVPCTLQMLRRDGRKRRKTIEGDVWWKISLKNEDFTGGSITAAAHYEQVYRMEEAVINARFMGLYCVTTVIRAKQLSYSCGVCVCRLCPNQEISMSPILCSVFHISHLVWITRSAWVRERTWAEVRGLRCYQLVQKRARRRTKLVLYKSCLRSSRGLSEPKLQWIIML